MIGSRIVQKLLDRGYRVRVLTRGGCADPRVEVFKADLSDEFALDAFIAGASLVFHCAAELRDESKMREVNVCGTETIIRLIAKHHIQYFCHMSSAGVIGRTSGSWVDESTPCNPQNTYEQTKYEAESFAKQPIEGCSTVILRPTNVVSENRLGALKSAMSATFKDKVAAFIKGGECAHIVHAEDVAEAAVYFISHSSFEPRVFFISIDHDPLNTVSNLWSISRSLQKNENSATSNKGLAHLPIFVPFVFRQLSGKNSNLGSVKYSSRKLTEAGFRFKFGVRETIKNVMRTDVLAERT